MFSKEPLKSHQLYEIRPASSDVAPVGRPIAHKSAEKQATGEAEYVDDMPRFENEAYLGLVLSSRSHAEIVSVDATAALEVEGVFCFISAKDIPSDRNTYNIVPILDEEVFASEKAREELMTESEPYSFHTIPYHVAGSGSGTAHCRNSGERSRHRPESGQVGESRV